MTTIQNSPVSGDRPPVLLRTQEVVRVTTLARSSIYRLVSRINNPLNLDADYKPVPPQTRPASAGGGLRMALVLAVMGVTSCNGALCGDGQGLQAIALQPFACFQKVF